MQQRPFKSNVCGKPLISFLDDASRGNKLTLISAFNKLQTELKILKVDLTIRKAIKALE
jgi:hypothetical protein